MNVLAGGAEPECLLHGSVEEWGKNFLHYAAPEVTTLLQNRIQSEPVFSWVFVYLVDARVKLEGVDPGVLSVCFTLVRMMP